jgi:hypothetical protein
MTGHYQRRVCQHRIEEIENVLEVYTLLSLHIKLSVVHAESEGAKLLATARQEERPWQVDSWEGEGMIKRLEATRWTNSSHPRFEKVTILHHLGSLDGRKLPGSTSSASTCG